MSSAALADGYGFGRRRLPLEARVRALERRLSEQEASLDRLLALLSLPPRAHVASVPAVAPEPLSAAEAAAIVGRYLFGKTVRLAASAVIFALLLVGAALVNDFVRR